MPGQGATLVERPNTTGSFWARPNPTMTPEELEWEYRHDACLFHKTDGQRSSYQIHPDWISEGLSPNVFKGRTNKPWPWEFPGARAMSDPKWELPHIKQAWKSQQMIGEIDHQLHRPRHWNGTQWTHVGTLHLNGKDPNGFSPFPPPNVYSNNLPAWAIYSGNNELSWNVLESNIKPFKLTDDLSHTRYSSALMSDSDKMSLRRMSGRYMTACDW